VLIGAVADDITGASDLCLMLSNAGLRTVQVMGVPVDGTLLPNADAVVIAIKSRNIPAQQAVAMSIAAAKCLMDAGAAQIMFKYCSTFDSTDAGNIGPVTEALLALTGADVTIACPAFPANGRTVYMGHLFVGDQLLSDSPMKDHPLTPMHDANLVRVLGRQTVLPIGLVTTQTTAQGAVAVQRAMIAAAAKGLRILVVDATTDADLMTLGAACKSMPLVTGGSGIARGLAANFIAADRVALASAPARMAAPAGRAVVLAGSCSAATLGQIAVAKAAGMPSFAVDVAALTDARQTPAMIAEWVIKQPGPLPPLVYSSADPISLAQSQAVLGPEASGALVEHSLAQVARLLQAAGIARFIIAGGETSGAVLEALDVRMLEIGPQIAPGVPWTRSIGGPDLALALKSGNFGGPDFFVKAWDLLEPEAL
jgi:3-dehydrotetronate 4-kinase